MRWALAAAAVLVAVAVTGGVVVMSSAREATPSAKSTPASTARVEKGDLSSMVSVDGTLTYRARSDGSPYSVINQAKGTYTRLPDEGDKVACGDVLYRVNDHPVLLLCGALPAYRDLEKGDRGNDVTQLNSNLGVLDDDWFTADTEAALKRLQQDLGVKETGKLDIADAVFLPRSARIAKVTGKPGGPARPGAQVAQATSDTLEVQVRLEAAQQGEVKVGDRARITLPGNRSVTGRVARLARVARAPDDENADAGAATIPAYLRLDHPKKARGLDSAPVQVDIKTKGVKSALSVPVTALVGKSGGGFAVEVVRGARRKLVAVRLGLFDTTGGRVQVQGNVREGDSVVVPSL